MVILDLLLVALIALGAFNGHKKGLVGVVVGFASLILSIVLAFGFQGIVSNAIYEAVYTDITPKEILEKLMNRKLKREEER